MTKPHDWLEFAHEDLILAEAALEKGIYNQACFHLQATCLKLDQYYILTRYPDVLPGMGSEGLPTRQDAEEVVVLLRDVLDWIKGKMER